MGLIFRLLRIVTLAATLALLVVVAFGGYLLFAGGDSRPDCAPAERSPVERVVQSVGFDAKLVGFLLASNRGFLSSISFDEAETAARAESFFSSRTDRPSDFAFCFEDGEATGFVRLKTVLGRRVGVRGKGTLDLSGTHPHLELSRATIAGVPVPGFLRTKIEEGANEHLDAIPILVPLQIHFSADRVTVTR